MATKQYTGPDPLYIRKIDIDGGAFPDDPDVADVAVTNIPDDGTWSVPNVRRGTMAPLKKLAISFAYFNAAGAEVHGGQADLYTYYVTPRQHFGRTELGRGIVRKTSEATGHNLEEDWICDVWKHGKMGIRLANITVPVGAVTLRICIQECE